MDDPQLRTRITREANAAGMFVLVMEDQDAAEFYIDRIEAYLSRMPKDVAVLDDLTALQNQIDIYGEDTDG